MTGCAILDGSITARKNGKRLPCEVLLAENAKLRELEADVLAYGLDGGFTCSDGIWTCPYFDECFNCPIEEGPEKYVRRGCRWLARGRELGVEVDDA